MPGTVLNSLSVISFKASQVGILLYHYVQLTQEETDALKSLSHLLNVNDFVNGRAHHFEPRESVYRLFSFIHY